MTEIIKVMLASSIKDYNKITYPKYISAKLDGIRCVINNGVVYSRSGKPIRSKVVQQLFGRQDLNMLDGELIAPNIQSNHENVTKPEFHCFSIFDIDKQEYLCPTFRRAVCDRLGIPHVKVVDENFILYHNVDQLLEMAEGEGMNPNVKREGIVFKSNTSQFSFKAISNKFLLKGGD